MFRSCIVFVAVLALPAAAQQLPAVAVSPSVADVNTEFDALDALLGAMPEAFGAWRGFCGPDPGSELAVRLAVFPTRFGLDPRSLARWDELKERASRVLDGAGSRGMPGQAADASAQMDRYVLDEILGRDEEARGLLDGAVTRGFDACLGCSALNSIVVNQRRSEDAERHGDADRALRHLHESVLDLAALETYYGSPCAQGLPAADLLLARYGLLLLRTGHEAVGLLALKDLVRTRPDTIGGRMARAELARRAALEDVDGARFLSGHVWGASAPDSCLVVAAWSVDDPKSMRWIAARLPRGSEQEWCRTVAFDAAAFEEASPSIASALSGPQPALDALTFANGLASGAEPYVDHFLESMRSDTRWPVALMLAADDRLRWMHGAGPEPSVPLGRCDGRALCEDWKTWRRSSGAKAGARP